MYKLPLHLCSTILKKKTHTHKERMSKAYAAHGQAVKEVTKKYSSPMHLYNVDEAVFEPDKFAGKFTPYSQPEDTYYDKKRMLAQASSGEGDMNFGKISAGDADISYLARAEAKQEYLEDLMAFGQMYDLNDPAQVEIARRINPEYFEILNQGIEDDAKMQERLAKIRLNGMRDWADVILILRIKRGQIVPSKSALWLPEQSGENDAERFKRGIFNPRKYMPLKTGDFNDPSGQFQWINNIAPGLNAYFGDRTAPNAPRAFNYTPLAGRRAGGIGQNGFNNYFCPPGVTRCGPLGADPNNPNRHEAGIPPRILTTQNFPPPQPPRQ